MLNRLLLGNRRYSSWSMRGWLAVRMAGLQVEDVVIPLGAVKTADLESLTPNGLVPVLEHDGQTIWDSLAICEYCAELSHGLWPDDRGPRATARSVAAEMHSGFRDMRVAMPMNLGRSAPEWPTSQSVMDDVARIDRLWQQCLATYGPFLFGTRMTIPDIMFAPVVARFLTYSPPISRLAQAYCETVRQVPLVAEWYRLAEQEPVAWRIAKYE